MCVLKRTYIWLLEDGSPCINTLVPTLLVPHLGLMCLYWYSVLWIYPVMTVAYLSLFTMFSSMYLSSNSKSLTNFTDPHIVKYMLISASTINIWGLAQISRPHSWGASVVELPWHNREAEDEQLTMWAGSGLALLYFSHIFWHTLIMWLIFMTLFFSIKPHLTW